MLMHVRLGSLPVTLIAVMAVLLLLLPADPADAAATGPQIGFVSGQSPITTDPDPVTVYMANADGSGLVDLTAGYGSEWPWAWSPDGSAIAFISHHDGPIELFVRYLDQAVPFAVADGPDPDYGMTWSPDGTRIAFSSSASGNSEIYVADVATRTAKNVSNDPGESTLPRWSPTGAYLSYEVRSEDLSGQNTDTFIVPASGGTPVNVTNDPAFNPGAVEGSWSPDGSRFVFVTNRDGNDEIYVAGANGQNQLRLTNSTANDRDPAWSPDGTRIAFSSGLETRDMNGKFHIVTPSLIYLMNSDGGNRHAITNGSIDPAHDNTFSLSQNHPVWSPDGSRLVFGVTIDGPGPHTTLFTLYTLRPSGGTPIEVWAGGGGWTLQWSPDGSRVAIRSYGNYGVDSQTVVALADGSGTPLQVTGGVGSGPAGWSTYGTRFAYENSGGAGPGDTVFVTNRDGSNPIAVSSSLPGPVNSGAAWRPQRLGQVGLVDTSTGLWHLSNGRRLSTSFYYGVPGDMPFMGDWDCDGVDTPGLYRQSDGYVYLRNSNTEGIADVKFFFGNPGDIPLAGDFDGDGCDTVSIYRPSEQRFYIINSLGSGDTGLGAAEYDFLFGNPGDMPVVGDWDGDGIDEVGLSRRSSGFFYWRNTLDTGIADGEIYYGDPNDLFVAGDWGIVDGADTPAIFRPSNTTFYFRHTLTQGIADSQGTWPSGRSSWLPVAGEFGLD
jgi:Tol biopolymer transport system component